VQMPEMDGLEATRAIRASEAAEQAGHVPIVAMTAHAMQGDRERCLEAGMDDYITKPVSLDALARVMAAWLAMDASQTPPPQGETMAPADTASMADEAPILDWPGVLDRLLGDEEFARSVIRDFLNEAPEQLGALQASVAAADAKASAQAAHSIKGSAATVGAEAVRAAAYSIERAARDRDTATLAARIPRLTAELDRLRRHVASWDADGTDAEAQARRRVS